MLHAHVVSVFADGTKQTTWTFDKAIVSLSDASGLLVPQGESINLASVTGEFTVGVLYDNFVDAESAWSCESASVAITFADGSTLQDGAGLTIGPPPP